MPKTRLMISGWKNGKLMFKERHDIDDKEIDTVLAPIAARHCHEAAGTATHD